MRSSPRHSGDDDLEIAGLPGRIQETERELQALTGGRVDAVKFAELDLLRARENGRATETMQLPSELQNAVLEALPARIALLDPEGVILSVNAAWKSFASAKMQQDYGFCVGQNYLAVCDEPCGGGAEESQDAGIGIRSVLSGEQTVFSLEYPCHSFSERWYCLMVTPLRLGPMVGAVVMHADVTERRQAEIDLRRSKQRIELEARRLHESQAMANVGSWETDLTTLATTWTVETHRIFGTSSAEFGPTHERFMSFVHPEDLIRVQAAFVESQGRSETYSIEHRICLEDGTIKHVEERWRTFHDNAGRPARAAGTCHDITKRKLAEEALRTRARQQEAIARIGLEATRATTQQGIFDFATRVVAEGLDVELCKLQQLAPDGSHLRLVSGVGWQPGLIGVSTVGVGEASQAGFTLQSAGPVFVKDLREEKRFQAPLLLTQHGVISGLTVPIPLKDNAWGILGAHCRFFREFDEHDALFMQSVATLLAVVIERLGAQRSLSRSERRMSDAQRIARLGNWEMEIASNRLVWSDEVYRIFGASQENQVASFEGVRALVHPADRERIDAAQRRALAGEEILEIEYRMIRPDGEIRHLREQGEVIHDENGRPVVLSGTVLDITERVNSEAERDRVFNLSIDLLSVGGFDGRLQRVNPAWTRCLGWSAEELTRMNWVEFVHPDDHEATVAAGAALVRGGRIQGFENRYRCKDGSYRWLSWNSHPLPETRQIFGVCRDITERKQTDLALIASNRALQLLSRCNEALVRSESEIALLRDICQIAVDVGGYRLAWVGYVQDDAEKNIALQACYGEGQEYLTGLQMSWSPENPNGQGPAGKVIRSGDPLIIPDLSKEPGFAPWLDRATTYGFAGTVVLPLKNRTRTFGILVVNTAEVRPAPHENERQLLRELADDMGFGIDSLRSRHERNRMEIAIQKMAASVSASGNQDFFYQLAANMAEALGAEAAFVSRLLPGNPPTARTIAAVIDGKPVENFDYRLFDTPCENLLSSHECIVSDCMADLFPKTVGLKKLGARAYVGRSLLNADQETVGFVFALYRKTLDPSEFLTSTLQVFAARATAELERRISDARVREQASLLDKARDAIVLCGLDQRIHYWNQSAERLYGWTAEEALGRSVIELLYHDSKEYQIAIESTMASGEWLGELQHFSKAGLPLVVEARWTLVNDEQGEPSGILTISSDITERKKLEQQFLRAQRMESIGTLAGGIAHDLNNVLAPIMMAIELLKMEELDAEKLGILNTIETSSKRGADMVKQVLSFARGVEGQQLEVQAGHLLKEIEQLANETFHKNIQVSCDVPADLWTVRGDPTQLHQVLLNLCVNARDAMPRGGTLSLCASNLVLDEHYAAMNIEAKPGPHVRIMVEDTGTGMPPEVVERIFEPFFTTKELGKGTGLGLSSTIAIIKSHGGFVRVSSEPGVGTRFHVYLPAQTESSDEGIETTPGELPRGTGQLILVIDDEAAIRQITQQTLETFGYRVVLAVDGAEAVAIYGGRWREIAAVITDMMMPILDGPATIRVLMRLNPEVRIIAASGLNSNGMVADAANIGIKHFIPKPYTAETLLKTLHSVLDPYAAPDSTCLSSDE